MMTKAQKILLYILYLLLGLMILFSILAANNRGQSGYDQCIQEKCDKKGEEFCNKFREINNCCLGAGGQTAINEGKAICVFA